MPATTHTPLGATTTNRKWFIDVNTAWPAGSAFIPIMGINNLVPNFDQASDQDDSDFDSSGFGSDTKTAAKWGAQFNVMRKVEASDPTSYDPGQEFLRLKSIGKFGVANSVQIRAYEMEPSGPRVEAYLGLSGCSWQDQGGNYDGLSVVQVSLKGKGALTPIAHPDTGAAVPVVSGVTPSTLAAAGGDVVLISGNRFTGATGVTIAGNAATHFTVYSDGLIAATAPAHAAGTGLAVVVTTAAGASSGGATVAYV